MTVGRCWQALTATVPAFTPLPERRVLLVGAHSLDDAEESVLRASDIAWLPPAQAGNPAATCDAVEQIAAETDLVHIHVDLDVHDPSIAPANSYASPGGLTAKPSPRSRAERRRRVARRLSHTGVLRPVQ